MISLGNNTFKHACSFIDTEIDYNVFNLIKDNDEPLTDTVTYHQFISAICCAFEFISSMDHEYVTIDRNDETFIIVALAGMLSGKTVIDSGYRVTGEVLYMDNPYTYKPYDYTKTLENIAKRIAVKEVGGMIFGTSGSTGTPQQVHLSWYNIMAAIHAFRTEPAINHGGIGTILHCLPHNHVYSFLMQLLFITMGSRTYYSDYGDLYKNYMMVRPTVMPVVPAILNKLYEMHLPLKLNLLICAGAPLRSDVAEFYRKTCRQILKGYGTTETTACLTLSLDPNDDGICTPANIIRIAEDGELLAKGLTVSEHSIEDDGWCHTKDIFSIDSDGRLHIIGRKSNVIKLQQGEFINLDELSILYTTNSIDTIVYATPLDRYPRAVVYIDDNINRNDIPEIFKDIHERNNRKGYERISQITIKSIKDMPLINGIKPDYKRIREEAIKLSAL
jgi:long-subunit acyl-CoA synthetase (AMP-forming)